MNWLVILVALITGPCDAQKVFNLDGMASDKCLDCICRGKFDCYITRPFWADAGKPLKRYDVCMKSSMRFCIKWTLQSYFSKFARDCNYDGVVDCFDYARIHIYGRGGCAGSRRKDMRRMDRCIAGVLGSSYRGSLPRIRPLIPALEKIKLHKTQKVLK